MKDLRQFIKTTIREFLNENVQKDIDKISKIIKDLSTKYRNEYKCSLKEINNGKCMDFAEELSNLINGEILSLNYFYQHVILDFTYEYHSDDDVIKTKNGGKWSKIMLDIYGYPPNNIDLSKIDDIDYHEWVFSNGLHYDAETPTGVTNFWDLPFFKRELKKHGVKNIMNEELKMTHNNFVVGKCYKYDELHEDIQYDINIQFKIFDEDPENANDKFDGFPEDYTYCFKYLKPTEIKTTFPLINDILKSKTNYLQKIIDDIKKNGLNNPPVGSEGNHRATAFYLMNIEMPYLEIKQKKHIKY